MSLQISTREHEHNSKPGVFIGAVTVEGEGVFVDFMFGGSFGQTREQAERNARIFVAALDFVDRVKSEGAL
ncbi:hypothetical protein [Cupriavidus necator]|uniref:hypothetical protein n=1 Tax=Cupriavidus necator TaxID=106590 RepID=UPI00339D9993